MTPSRPSAAVLRLVPPPGDEALVAGARAGDASARRALVERYAQHVAGVLHNVVGARAPLEDLAQDVFLVVFRDLGQLREPAALRGWITRVAVHRARTHIRSAGRQRWLRYFGWLDEEPEPPAAPGLSAEDRELARATYEVLDGLPERERTAFALRFVEGMSLPEVADAMELSLATTKRMLRAAEDRFRTRAACDARLRHHLGGERP